MPSIEYQRPKLYKKQEDALFHDKRWGLVEASTKAGKAQPLDALVYTPTGPVRMGDVHLGQTVSTPFGQSTVQEIHPQGLKDIYRFEFNDGSAAEATLEHLWEVNGDPRSYECGVVTTRIVSTEQLIQLSKEQLRHLWVRVASVDYAAQEVPIHPYVLGVLIGDGCIGAGGRETLTFTCADPDIAGRVRQLLPKDYRLVGPDNRYTYGIVLTKPYQHVHETERIIPILKQLGLWGLHSQDKFVPDCYKYNSSEVRLEVLRGILDTDGSVDSHGQPLLEQTSGRLCADVAELVESLGGSTRFKVRTNVTYQYKSELRQGCPVYRQSLSYPHAGDLFCLPRKKTLCHDKIKPIRRYLRSISLSRQAEAQCITLADDRGLYFTDRHVVTHNSVGCICWLVEQAVKGKPGNNYWWVAPIFRQAQIMFNRTQNFLPRNIYTANKTERRITLLNGTHIWFLGAENPDSLYGEDVYAAVIDEASRVRHESAIAVFSTLTATGGSVRIIGNVKGRRNWFYLMARKAEAGEPDHAFARITAADAISAGVLDKTVVEQIRSNMPEDQARQLFDAEAADDEGNPFGLEAIAACVAPMSEADPFAFGWDFAKSKDWTVGIGLDEQMYACALHRWNKGHPPPMWPAGAEYWDGTLQLVEQFTGGVPALCDSTGLGDPLIERLEKLGRFTGKKFTTQSKQQLMEGLAVAIQKREVRFPDGPIRAELEIFEYVVTRTGVLYSAPEGQHDDCVCALALAVAQHGEGQVMSWVDDEVADDPNWYMNDKYAYLDEQPSFV